MERLVVVRDLSRVAGGVVRSASSSDLIVENVELSPESLAWSEAESSVVGAAPEMRTSLIAPSAGTGPGGSGGAWGLAVVGAEGCNYDGSNVLVAVLDTGIDRKHQAFRGVDLVEEDFVQEEGGDLNGHGTHCAGTIFGRPVDDVPIGVAPGVDRALIGKILDRHGHGTTEGLLRGLTWAASENAQVVSVSLGVNFAATTNDLVESGWPPEVAAARAIEAYTATAELLNITLGLLRSVRSYRRGAVVVAAAGNDSRRELNAKYDIATSLPANAVDVVSVGALGRVNNSLRVWEHSNSSPVVVAPGVNIRSAQAGGGTTSLTGTSMACPHVAGVAALWWQAVAEGGFPVNATTIRQRLLGSTRLSELHTADGERERGSGLVQAPRRSNPR